MNHFYIILRIIKTKMDILNVQRCKMKNINIVVSLESLKGMLVP